MRGDGVVADEREFVPKRVAHDDARVGAPRRARLDAAVHGHEHAAALERRRVRVERVRASKRRAAGWWVLVRVVLRRRRRRVRGGLGTRGRRRIRERGSV